MDRGNHGPHRNAEIYQGRFGYLQRGFHRLGHRLTRPGLIQSGRLGRIARPGDDGNLRNAERRRLVSRLTSTGSSMVRITALGIPTFSRPTNVPRDTSPNKTG